MNPRRKHTSPKNGGDRRGGTRPQAHTWVRQIVTCDNIVLDRQIVAWAAVQGRRHKLVDNSNYFLFRHISNTLLWDLVGCQINNNGGEYGIKIRLHKHRLQQLEQRGSRNGSQFLLDLDGCRNPKYNGEEFGRNFIPGFIFTKSWTWTMDSRPGTKDYNWMAEKVYWIWNQCWRKIQSQMAAFSNQLFSLRCGKQCKVLFQRVRKIGGQGWTIERSLLTKLFLVSKSSPRKNLSQDGNHQHLAFGHCSWTTEKLQKSGGLVNLFMIKQKFLPGNFSKNTTKKNRINSFPPDPGRDPAWVFLYPNKKINKIRPQAHN